MSRLQDEIAVELERMAANRRSDGVGEQAGRRIGTVAAAAIRPAGPRGTRRTRSGRRLGAVRRALRRLLR